ncbi:MAG: ATP-binding protein [Leptolyngbyaceae cyanobacterium bins.59]|nr:ATP-binding protein [Leptolyngbyaceae cyanobacterium bins.59]
MKGAPKQLERRRWLPLLAGLGGAIVTLALWQFLSRYKQQINFLEAQEFWLPELLLSVGLLFSGSIARLTYLVLVARQQNQVIAQKNQHLLTELARYQEMQSALAISEQQNRVLLESIPDLMIRMRRDGFYLDCKPARGFASMLPPQESVGKNIYEILPQELADQRMRFVQEALATGEVQSYEFQLMIQGELHQQEARIVASGSNEVLVIIRDITDRHQIEMALERLMRQNELILNSAGEGICGLDLQGRITFMNPAASRMLGYEIGELLYQTLHTVVQHHKLDGTPYSIEESPIHKSLREGMVQHRSDEVFWRRDGSSFPVEYVSTPIRERVSEAPRITQTNSPKGDIQIAEELHAEDEIVGTVIVFQDITERRSIERMKDEFISVVSHELRTPLTSIRGALGLIATGKLGELSDRGQNLLDIAVTNADRLVRLVNDILDLERIESGRITMEKRLHDAADLIQQTRALMQTLADKAGVDLIVTPLSVPLWVDGDRIIQALTNLLSNAIKFSKSGDTIWLTAQLLSSDSPVLNPSSPISPPPQQLLLSVRDQGRGIPADKIEIIFGRFQQVDASDSREKGGTGLGLAICRSIVQQHDGRLWVESTLGEGSTFYFTLPVLKENSGDNATNFDCG